ncbi:MAG: hypothetical protein RLZZ450_1222 [Pseudomonadota bacterium]
MDRPELREPNYGAAAQPLRELGHLLGQLGQLLGLGSELLGLGGDLLGLGDDLRVSLGELRVSLGHDWLSSPFTLNANFIETSSDWAVGQSGGPAYGVMPGVSQFVAFGIISYSNLTTTKSVARRLTSAIVTKLCQEIRANPSTSYPAHECGP